MFTTLLVKEWKDKAVIALFGLIMMAAFAAAFIALDGQDDLREIVAAGFLSVFFPAIAAILGAGAFEAEFRDGAWAYLLSRPVRKETVWLAKLAALLSVLAGFWLIFLGLMAAVPGLGGIIAGYKLPGMHGLVLNMPPLVLFTSLFFFSAAFSLSILSEKLLSLVLGSIFLSSFVQALLTSVAFQAEGRGLLSKAGLYPWLDAYKLALVLSCLAFLAASLVTFRRADFSQPRKKAAALARYASLFLAAAWLLSALWPTLRPGRPEELESEIHVVGDNAYFATTRGFYRYDISRDSLKKVTRWNSWYSRVIINDRKVLYSGWDGSDLISLRVMNLDGTEKKMLLGAEAGAGPVVWDAWGGLALSPDGRRAAVIAERYEKIGRNRPEAVWIIPTDGSGKNESLRLDPALRAQLETAPWFRIVAWETGPESLILLQDGGDIPSKLWRFDLATGAQRQLFEAVRIRFRPVSALDGSAFVTYRPHAAGPVVAALIDLVSGKSTEVTRVEEVSGLEFHSAFSSHSWSATGEDLAFLIPAQKGLFIPARFNLKEGHTVMASGKPIEVSSSGMPSIAWAAGDSRLILVLPRERSLKILDRNLAEVGSIGFPEAVTNLFFGRPAGKAILYQADHPQSVWRLDLDTEKWKRIW